MRRKFAGAIAAAVMLLLPATSAAGQVRSDAEIRAVLEARVDSTSARGIVVGIIEPDGTRRFVAYGTASDSGAAVDEHTIFEIGSISKTFTSLLLAEAVVRGELELDQPVASLLPDSVEMPAYDGQAITLEHLATHRSGLPRVPANLFPAALTDPYAGYDAERLFTFLGGYTLPRAPGADAEYSNLAVGLLGWVLTRHADAPSWATLVEQRITQPLGMDETYVDVPTALHDRVAQGHNARGAPVPAWHFDALAGAGAQRSTASDMLTYLAAQLDPPDDTLGTAIRLTQEPRADFSSSARAGLGWIIRESDDGVTYLHDGGTGGFSSLAAFAPETGTAAVVLSNAADNVVDIGLWLVEPSFPTPQPRAGAR